MQKFSVAEVVRRCSAYVNCWSATVPGDCGVSTAPVFHWNGRIPRLWIVNRPVTSAPLVRTKNPGDTYTRTHAGFSAT